MQAVVWKVNLYKRDLAGHTPLFSEVWSETNTQAILGEMYLTNSFSQGKHKLILNKPLIVTRLNLK